MDYSYGTSYGYDEFQVSPLLNNYDAPHLQMNKMFADEPYRKAVTGSYDAPPFVPPPPPPRPPQDTSKIPQSFSLGAESISGGDIDSAIMVFVAILLLIVLLNTMRVRQLNDRMKYMETEYMIMMAVMNNK
jgi:hypothetical protein